MKIQITWGNLLELGANGNVEIGENTLEIVRPAIPHLRPDSYDKTKPSVVFTLDETDPGTSEYK
jgi:hypothetical protein